MQIQLQCPNCASQIKSEDINLPQLLAKCWSCHTVFSFEGSVASAERNRPQIVTMPPGIEAFSLLSELSIQISWRKSASGFLIFFTIFWNAVLIPFIAIAIATGEWVILLFISLHLFVGISLLYWMIAVLLNTTYITVNQREITIEHKPIAVPFYPNRLMPVEEVEQLFTEKYVNGRTNGQPNFAFSLKAIKKNHEHIPLVKGLKSYEQALYVEQQVERFLNIKDRAVAEEYKA